MGVIRSVYDYDPDAWGQWNVLAAPAASISPTFPGTGSTGLFEFSLRSDQTGATVASGKLTVITSAGSDTTNTNYHTQWNSAINGSASVVESTNCTPFQHATNDCVSGYFSPVNIRFHLFCDTDRQKSWRAEWELEQAALNVAIGRSASKRQGGSIVGTSLDAIVGMILSPGSGNWLAGSKWRFQRIT